MHVLFAGIAGAIVIFIADGLMQRMPVVIMVRKEYEDFEGVKKWGREARPLLQKIVIMLIEGFFFAFAFALIRAGLSSNVVLATLQFWFLLAAVRIIPESMEFWHETNYPLQLIWLEAGMDAVSGLAVAFTFAFIIA